MPRLSKLGAAALAAFGWTSGSSVSASYLVVAGGGSGGKGNGGGGGAGGYQSGTASLNPSLSYTITVGAGGAAVSSGGGNTGSNSVFSSITANGGGAGGAPGGVGGNGGSGGGGGNDGSGLKAGGTGSQGFAGGTNGAVGASSYASGGGGGSSSVGANATAGVGGAGGNGTASSISGSSVTYAGGGGGGTSTGTGGTAGTGGGGVGGVGAGAGGNGTANTGGGGGGSSTASSGAGGSGIVIISYAGAQQFGGGVVTTDGTNTIHTFTTSGTLSPITTLSASYLIVAGGGGGGSSLWASTTNGAGGGGAGGLLSGSSLTIDPNSTYLVTVGAGGAGSTAVSVNGSTGSNSIFSMVSTTASGGGGGGSQFSSGGVMGSGQSGGSGGGGCGAQVGNTAGGAGTGTAGQGYNGGAGLSQDPNRPAGGGGGSGGAGVAGSGSNGGNGGVATASSISGTSTYYAGGGGGGVVSGTAGLGGGTSTSANKGGAGDGAVATASGGAGTANTGGGGGGAAGAGTGNGGNGGSGVVIISYPGSTQQMAGGTVTITGGNVIHTFTSSGYLTPIKYVSNSLRFRSSASAYLNRTFTTPTNNLKWTWSGWIKRGAATDTTIFSQGIGATNTYAHLYYSSTGELNFGQINGAGTVVARRTTTAVYRDYSAWYHVVMVYDSANATASNRLLMYVNGVQITSFSISTDPSLNLASYINSAATHRISSIEYSPVLYYFDGYLTEINFIDGQALTPNSFGTINSYGVWQPITYGGSYGTNGFYLPFTNKTSTTTLGYDFSPNGNNWTTNNISLTAGATYDSMTDVPTLTSATAANYAVLNPLSTLFTVTAGNLDFTYTNSTSGVWYLKGTLAVSSDKYYWEVTPTNVGGGPNISIGIILSTNTQTNTTTTNLVTDGYVYHCDGNKYSGAGGTTGVAYGATYTNNDVIGVALDLTAGTLVFYKNNVSQGTAFTGLTSSYMLLICNHLGGTSRTVAGSVNAGQRPFTYTPPSGFVALNTYNL